MVNVEEKKRAEKDALTKAKNAIQVDDVVSIRQLGKKNAVDVQMRFNSTLKGLLVVIPLLTI